LPAGIVLAGHERFDLVVVSRSLLPELRPLVTWRRARAPASPFRLRWAVFYATAAIEIARARADVVHVRAPAPLVPNRVDLASVAFCHAGFDEAARREGHSRSRPARAATLALERWTYAGGRAALVDVETTEAAATFTRHYPGVPVEVVPLSYDLDRFRPDPEARREARAEMGATPGEVVALCPGRDHHAKGVHFAIEGIALAGRPDGPPLWLWVTGPTDTERVDRLAEEAGVRARVKALGWRDDMERLYAGADMLVLPTLYEQGSRASHEAALCELPLVATRVHGAAPLIGDDEGGIAVERDPESVGNAIARLAGDTAMRERMGRAARSRCLAITAGADPVGRWLDLYERLAA
jgi:glycosyltransferase involved in cell wall biosynthesis